MGKCIAYFDPISPVKDSQLIKTNNFASFKVQKNIKSDIPFPLSYPIIFTRGKWLP